jgi:hypothetical protein
MIITYIRSSSYGTYNLCPQQYFLRYVLGLHDPGGKAAERGTIVHKVMECLARGKECEQNEQGAFEDSALGIIDVYDNASYAPLYSEELVDKLLAASYKYYETKSIHTYTRSDWEACRQSTYKALSHYDGMLDPRKMDIVAAEPKFDIMINEPWAEYDYMTPHGERIHGHLAIKGTIDLVHDLGNNICESVDWKTGQRKNWATNERKDFFKLCVDHQLRIYHLALTHMFPDIKQFIPTIFYINDGGPFSMAFGPEDIAATYKMLRRRFEEVRSITRPQLITGYNTWKCRTFCHFGMNEHPSGTINKKTGKPHTICSYIAEKIRKQGIDTVMSEDTRPEHHVDFYQDPGE